MTTTIWHNPRCSKSRQTLALLEERGLEPEIVLYLQEPPTVSELKTAVSKLGCDVKDIIRKGETAYKEQKVPAMQTEPELLEALNQFPILIERPIVFHGDKAAVGRPPENVLDLF